MRYTEVHEGMMVRAWDPTYERHYGDSPYPIGIASTGRRGSSRIPWDGIEWIITDEAEYELLE